MKILDTPISGLKIIESAPMTDNRGEFTRWYCEKELAALLGGQKVVQVNHSRSFDRGTVRGMHYQIPPHAEMKCVRCLSGHVWDITIDLRASSPTFLQWHAVELTPDNQRMVIIPQGCAHGFQVLEEGSALLYLHTAFYEPSAAFGVHPSDPRIGIAWPMPPINLSEKDKAWPLLPPDFVGV